VNPLLQAVVGYLLLLGLAWTLSSRRRAIPWRTVLGGIGLQLALALLIFRLPGAREIFAAGNDALLAIAAATREGTRLVFGFLGGASLPYAETVPGSSFVLAFQALPVVLVMSALSAVLYHWRVLPWLVRGFSVLLERTLGVGGAVGMSTAANVFVGMVEAPLLIRPYLASVSRGEMFIILSGGMAGVAGTVMALYASILGPVVPDALGHILAASFISAPAAIVFAVILVPPEGQATGQHLQLPPTDHSTMEAITRGTGEGATLLINIAAMLIVLVAMVSLTNQVLGLLPTVDAVPLVPAAPAGLADGALCLDGRHSLGRIRCCWLAAGDQDSPQRVDRLPRHGAAFRGRADAAQQGHHDLCPVRFRQSGKSRHSSRRHVRHRAGTSARNRPARPLDAGFRHPGDALLRQCRGHATVTQTAGMNAAHRFS
jgi:CNT family concentrative nucleoside transporter